MKEKNKLPTEELPSAADDCADVNSAYEKYKKKLDKTKNYFDLLSFLSFRISLAHFIH